MNLAPTLQSAPGASEARRYTNGILMSALGMILISPDGLLLRLIGDGNRWDIIFFRSGFTAVSFCVVLLVRHRKNIFRHLYSLGRYALLSGLILSSGNFLFVNAITHTSIANTLAILATMPLFSAVLGRAFIGERVRPRTVATIFVAFGGVLTIFIGSIGVGNWVGNLFAFGVAFIQGLNLVVMRKAGNGDRIPALCLAAILSSSGAFLLGAHPTEVNTHDLRILALAGLIMLPTAMWLFLSGTRYVPAAEIAILSLIETVLGPVWAWVGVGEIPAATSLVGGAIVITAVTTNTLLGVHDRRRSPTPPVG